MLLKPAFSEILFPTDPILFVCQKFRPMVRAGRSGQAALVLDFLPAEGMMPPDRDKHWCQTVVDRILEVPSRYWSSVTASLRVFAEYREYGSRNRLRSRPRLSPTLSVERSLPREHCETTIPRLQTGRRLKSRAYTSHGGCSCLDNGGSRLPDRLRHWRDRLQARAIAETVLRAPAHQSNQLAREVLLECSTATQYTVTEFALTEIAPSLFSVGQNALGEFSRRLANDPNFVWIAFDQSRSEFGRIRE